MRIEDRCYAPCVSGKWMRQIFILSLEVQFASAREYFGQLVCWAKLRVGERSVTLAATMSHSPQTMTIDTCTYINSRIGTVKLVDEQDI